MCLDNKIVVIFLLISVQIMDSLLVLLLILEHFCVVTFLQLDHLFSKSSLSFDVLLNL